MKGLRYIKKILSLAWLNLSDQGLESHQEQTLTDEDVDGESFGAISHTPSERKGCRPTKDFVDQLKIYRSTKECVVFHTSLHIVFFMVATKKVKLL